VHSVSDLIYASLFLLCAPLTLFFAKYANGVVSGLRSDARQLQEPVSQFMQFPQTFFSTVISLIIPAYLIVVLLYRRRFFELFEVFLALCIANPIAVTLLGIISTINDKSLSGSFIQSSTGAHPALPVYLIYVCALLIVCGPKSHEKSLNVIALILIGVEFVMIVFTILSPMSVVLTSVSGLMLGYLIRFILGQSNARLTDAEIKDQLKKRGFAIDGIVTQEKEYDAMHRELKLCLNGHKRTLWIYDYDKLSVSMLNNALHYIKFKNVDFRFRSPFSQFEHISLMFHTAYSNGLNSQKLITSWMDRGSILLLFDASSEPIPLEKSNLTDEFQLQYWQYIEQAHQKGIVFHSIQPHNLQILNNFASIQTTRFSDISTNVISRRLDDAELLVLLALFSTPDAAVSNYIKFLGLQNTGAQDEKIVDRLVQTTAGVNKFNLSPQSRLMLKQKDSNTLQAISTLLNNAIDTFDVKPEVLQFDYKRIGLAKVLSLGLTVFAVMALLTQLNWDAVSNAVAASQHMYALLSLLASIVTFLGGAIALRGFAFRLPVKIREAFFVQVAASWAAVQLPAALGPITMNVRYLNKIDADSRSSTAANSAVGGVVQSAQAIVSTIMLIVFGLLTGQGVITSSEGHFEFNDILLVLLLLLVIVMVTPPIRKALLKLVSPFVKQFIDSLKTTLRSPKGVAIGLLGCVVQEFGYALALYFALLSFGQSISFPTVFFVFLVANAAGSAVPIPGGLGAYEAALTLALTTVGVSPTIALSSTLLYRIVTFWVRAPIGALVSNILKKRAMI
jgi:uncharacterized protein (TIRG00374 family)